MFIYVAYKDAPELSLFLQRSSSDLLDPSIEKKLLVNPKCPIRIVLEYIRDKCKLGANTNFDLCESNGGLKGLFTLPSHEYATDLFENKKTYYLIVLYSDNAKRVTVLPQLNHENEMYSQLVFKVNRFMTEGVVTNDNPRQSTAGSSMKNKK